MICLDTVAKVGAKLALGATNSPPDFRLLTSRQAPVFLGASCSLRRPAINARRFADRARCRHGDDG